MARIAGVNLPNNKRLEIGLTYIYGIGQSTAQTVCKELELDPDQKVKDLTDDEVTKLRTYIDTNLEVEGDLRRERSQAIKRLSEIGCYRGVRHRRGLPVHGQRTKTNARTRKGPKKPSDAERRRSSVAPPRKSAARGRRAAASGRTSPSGRPTSRPRSTTRSCPSPTRRGTSIALGVRRVDRLQGLAQVDAVRRTGDGRQCRPQGYGAWVAEGRGRSSKAPAPVARPRSGRSRPPVSRSSVSATSRPRPTTAFGRRSGGACSGRSGKSSHAWRGCRTLRMPSSSVVPIPSGIGAPCVLVARYTGPKEKLSRREGVNLMLKGERALTDKSAYERRPYPPRRSTGAVVSSRASTSPSCARSRRRSASTASSSGSSGNYYKKASRKTGNPGENLMVLLETRLDNVVYRLGFASTQGAGPRSSSRIGTSSSTGSA